MHQPSTPKLKKSEHILTLTKTLPLPARVFHRNNVVTTLRLLFSPHRRCRPIFFLYTRTHVGRLFFSETEENASAWMELETHENEPRARASICFVMREGNRRSVVLGASDRKTDSTTRVLRAP